MKVFSDPGHLDLEFSWKQLDNWKPSLNRVGELDCICPQPRTLCWEPSPGGTSLTQNLTAYTSRFRVAPWAHMKPGLRG